MPLGIVTALLCLAARRLGIRNRPFWAMSGAGTGLIYGIFMASWASIPLSARWQVEFALAPLAAWHLGWCGANAAHCVTTAASGLRTHILRQKRGRHTRDIVRIRRAHNSLTRDATRRDCASPSTFYVRMRKAPISAGAIPARRQSLQPVAIGAVEEVTNPLKHFGVEDCLGQFGEQAGRNASERRAGLETWDAEADPPLIWGRPPS